MELERFPEAFVANVCAYGGAGGESWLRDLPGLVARAARRWGLDAPSPLAGLSFNYLLAAKRGRRRVVAKFVCERAALASELAWLRAQQGRGAVDLIAVAEDLGAYLMEEIAPARPAAMLEEDVASAAVAAQIARLAGPEAPPADVPGVATWFAELPALALRRLPGIERSAILRADALARALVAAPQDECLLHGDLHHHNVLASADGWRVVDPKGVRGDPAHECAAMLRNRLHDVSDRDVSATLRKRVRVLAEVTAFDPARIAAWGYAQTVLSCCWSAQAGQQEDIDRGMAVAEALLRLV